MILVMGASDFGVVLSDFAGMLGGGFPLSSGCFLVGLFSLWCALKGREGVVVGDQQA